MVLLFYFNTEKQISGCSYQHMGFEDLLKVNTLATENLKLFQIAQMVRNHIKWCFSIMLNNAPLWWVTQISITPDACVSGEGLIITHHCNWVCKTLVTIPPFLPFSFLTKAFGFCGHKTRDFVLVYLFLLQVGMVSGQAMAWHWRKNSSNEHKTVTDAESCKTMER